MATDRSGVTVSVVLATVSADAMAAVPAPLLGKDALLVTHGAMALPPCARQLGVTHEGLNQSAGEPVRGALPIQTVNSRHERFKGLLRRHRGIASKCLDSSLKWFHLAGIHADPSPRACLDAALGCHAKGLRTEPSCFT